MPAQQRRTPESSPDEPAPLTAREKLKQPHHRSPQRPLDTVVRLVRDLQVQDLIKTGDTYRRVIGLRQIAANSFVVTVVSNDSDQRLSFEMPGDVSLVVADS
jgi:hypothetical protein